MVTRVYSRATASNAKRFLMEFTDTLPFPLLPVQTDGGSELTAEFGMGMSAMGIRHPQRRDLMLLLSALSIALLTLLGAAGESLGCDRG